MTFLRLRDRGKKTFLILTLLFFVYVLPIIVADRYYNDDLARALTGATGWNEDGRPLAEMLMKFICGGSPIVDISPLPLLGGIVLLAYVLALYGQKNFNDNEQLFPQVCGLFLVIGNPFLLANLSYKFDVLGMLSALCAAIICFVLPEDTPKWKQFFADVILCLTALALYQAVIGAFLALLLIDLYLKKQNEKICWSREFLRLAGFGVSGVFYKVAIADFFVSKEDWRAEASQYISEISIQSLKMVWNNFCKIVSLITGIIPGISVPIILVTLAVIAFDVYKIVELWKTKASGRLFWSFYILFLPAGALGMCILPLILLRSLGAASRILISLSICLLLLGIFLLSLYQKNKIMISAVFAVCMISSFAYSFAYGNALKGQKNYEIYMGMSIVQDIERINASNEYTKLTIDGDMPRSQQVQMMCQKYPQFDEIIPVYITNDSWRGGAWLFYYMQNNPAYEEMQEEDYEIIRTGAPVMKNQIYSCYVRDEKIIIHFNEEV